MVYADMRVSGLKEVLYETRISERKNLQLNKSLVLTDISPITQFSVIVKAQILVKV